MSDVARAEKLASAKKKLKQFQQKHRDNNSGRSTPSRRFGEEDVLSKSSKGENGSSNACETPNHNSTTSNSGSVSPTRPTDERNGISLNEIFNGNSHSDVFNDVSNKLNNLNSASDNIIHPPSPCSIFTESEPISSQMGSDFFDNLTTSMDQPDRLLHSSVPFPEVGHIFEMNEAKLRPPVESSTPDGPRFVDTPNYSFPDASVSPIVTETIDNYPKAVELELKLKNSSTRNNELEQQLNEQKNQILQLQSHLEEMKKRADENAFTLKHHVQAIEILVAEKTELQNNLAKQLEGLQLKEGEVGELQARLRASRHRVSELERELGVVRTQVSSLDRSVQDLNTQQASWLEQTDLARKRVRDLELEVSDLHSQLENRDKTITSLRSEIDTMTSQLDLAEVRIQQLNGGSSVFGQDNAELYNKNVELSNKINNLESQLNAIIAAKEDAIREYQHYVDGLETKLQEEKTAKEVMNGQLSEISLREQHLIHRVRELELETSHREQRPEHSELQLLQNQLHAAENTSSTLQQQLELQSSEVAALREGLRERALQIQELEISVNRLEAERPDSVNLQAAIESDKVAASRAVQQNNNLKKQLEELQEALIKLSNNKLELTQQLQHEQHLSHDLSVKLEKYKVSKCMEVDRGQQTESPPIQEAEAQTITSYPAMSPEVLLKLEEKFQKTMGELADLSDEKQQLEHLVLQLQSETETIGEYITLYQFQRGMLRQRAQEKDEQVAKLAQDKEALRNKLTQLNHLVQRLVAVKHCGADEVVLSVGEDMSGAETAQQISSLLSEIGTNTLITSATENSNVHFHCCPLCSGRLITV